MFYCDSATTTVTSTHKRQIDLPSPAGPPAISQRVARRTCFSLPCAAIHERTPLAPVPLVLSPEIRYKLAILVQQRPAEEARFCAFAALRAIFAIVRRLSHTPGSRTHESHLSPECCVIGPLEHEQVARVFPQLAPAPPPIALMIAHLQPA